MDFLTTVLAPASKNSKRKADEMSNPAPTDPVGAADKKLKKTPAPPKAVAPSLSAANAIISELETQIKHQQKTVAIPNILHNPIVDISSVDRVRELIKHTLTDKVDDPNISQTTRRLIAEDIQNTMGPSPLGPVANRVMHTNIMVHQVVVELMKRYDEREREKLGRDEAAADVITRIALPTCTRLHEESQLREPRENERKCVAGIKCECYLEPKFNFIMKEFLTHEEEMESQKSNTTKNEHGYCLYCIREICTRSFIMAVVMKLKMTHKFTCQTHLIMVNIPGEYKIEDCFFTGITSPYAQICNTPTIYSLHTSHHGKMLKQTGLGTIAAEANPHAPSQGFQRGVLQ